MDDHNNRRHAHISLERTGATKFWPDRNFAWYLAASEFNAALAMGHFQNGGVLQPSLDFRRGLAKECLENTIRLEPGDIGRPQRGCTIPAGLECQLVSVSHYCGMWDGGFKKCKKSSRNIKSNAARRTPIAKIGPGHIANSQRDYFCALDASQIIKWRS